MKDAGHFTFRRITMLNKLKTLTQLSISLLFLCLAGCATIEGAGEDIESAGEVIQESAENNN